MAIARYLVDTSAMNRLARQAVRDRLAPLIEKGLVATCPMLDLEALFQAQSPGDYERIRGLRTQFEPLESGIDDWDFALATQAALAKQSRHRVKIPDLVIAATAHHHRVTLLHYDHDFDLISEITGQDTEWVVERGSVS